jgi:hypothetical protein
MYGLCNEGMVTTKCWQRWSQAGMLNVHTLNHRERESMSPGWILPPTSSRLMVDTPEGAVHVTLPKGACI